MKKPLKLFDTKKNINKLLIFFYSCLVLLLIIDPFIPKHADFPWEEAPNFFAAYGFGACVMLIFVARILRIFLKRGEDYFD